MSPENFSHGLRSRIRARHDGDLPSASELARALNQADQWRRPVSAETMRRWIRGLSLPELHRVPALSQWLDCSPGDLFLLASAESPADAALGRLQQGGPATATSTTATGLIGKGLDIKTCAPVSAVCCQTSRWRNWNPCWCCWSDSPLLTDRAEQRGTRADDAALRAQVTDLWSNGWSAGIATRPRQKKNPAAAGLIGWCPGEDSNLHSVATART